MTFVKKKLLWGLCLLISEQKVNVSSCFLAEKWQWLNLKMVQCYFNAFSECRLCRSRSVIVSWCWRTLEWTGLLWSCCGSPAALQECESGPDGDGGCERSGVRRGRGGCVRRWGGGMAFVCFPRFKTRTEKWIDRGKSIAWPSHRARVKEGWRERERDGEGEPRSNGGTMRDKRKK